MAFTDSRIPRPEPPAGNVQDVIPANERSQESECRPRYDKDEHSIRLKQRKKTGQHTKYKRSSDRQQFTTTQMETCIFNLVSGHCFYSNQ